jgi:iron transport multicopper oxidase
VVLDANQSPNNYWIRALPSSGNNLTSTFEGGVNSAILRYKGASNAEPTTTQQTSQDLLVEADLHPLFNPTAPGRPTPDGADTTLTLIPTFDTSTFRFSINGTSFVPPSVPVLLQILSGARNAYDLLPEGSVYTLERRKTVQINLPSNVIGGPHPFHLLGVSYVHLSYFRSRGLQQGQHTFSVVRSADTGKFNFFNPPKRDVVSLGTTEGDFISIRFTTDNPGPWILHWYVRFLSAYYMAGLYVML